MVMRHMTSDGDEYVPNPVHRAYARIVRETLQRLLEAAESLERSINDPTLFKPDRCRAVVRAIAVFKSNVFTTDHYVREFERILEELRR